MRDYAKPGSGMQKSKTVQVRLTERDKQLLDRAAKKNGKTVSQWCRDALIEAAEKRLRRKLRQ